MEKVVIIKKATCSHPECDRLSDVKAAERQRAQREEAEKIKRELLTLARRVEELTRD